MAKKIKEYTLELRKVGDSMTGCVRYQTNSNEYPNQIGFGDIMSFDPTGNIILDSNLAEIENEIKIKEGIS